MLTLCLLGVLAFARLANAECECGWRLPAYENPFPWFTHRLVYNFSTYRDDIDAMLTDDKAKAFRND